MFEEFMMWIYGSMALMVWALLWVFETRPKKHTYPPEWICDGSGQVCSELKEGYCEYCAEKY